MLPRWKASLLFALDITPTNSSFSSYVTLGLWFLISELRVNEPKPLETGLLQGTQSIVSRQQTIWQVDFSWACGISMAEYRMMLLRDLLDDFILAVEVVHTVWSKRAYQPFIISTTQNTSVPLSSFHFV
ncbi:hypothetical protein ACN38_g1827 [Penicillium nordicum]|uniref:Uncharacterized protein n=1 Tax=Penicillium nordicum TaxID=229535 RepID=A0A0M9WJH5_9EURO|nr:hypothetical protein ACN38_g1827 [Penicillium nordicum]